MKGYKIVYGIKLEKLAEEILIIFALDIILNGVTPSFLIKEALAEF